MRNYVFYFIPAKDLRTIIYKILDLFLDNG